MHNEVHHRKTWLACPREKSGAISCPGRCACLDVPGDPEPHRFVCEPPFPGGGGEPNVQRLTWNTRVDFCARELPLKTLASFLAGAFPGQVYVPAEKIHSVVSSLLDGVTLADVARESGLVITEPSSSRLPSA